MATSSAIRDLAAPPPVGGNRSVLFFWAAWHSPSTRGGAVDKIFEALANSSSGIDFYRVEAEACPELSLKYGVTVVPSFILLNSEGSIVERVDGGDDIPRLTQAVSALSVLSSPTSLSSSVTTAATPTRPQETSAVTPKSDLNDRLKSLVTSSDVMLFMKGSPASPRCGFSRQAVEILTNAGIVFGTFDILGDEEVRQGLKSFSDWPTYPQIYVKGELVGGLDILKEMAEGDEDLAAQLGIEKTKPAELLKERLGALICRNRVMLFMKGLPSAPRCGFSRQIVEILEEEGVPFDTFNILEDEEVRQGLKEFSDWPTYPQLYVDGDLIGGLDIVREMKESGDLTELLAV